MKMVKQRSAKKIHPLKYFLDGRLVSLMGIFIVSITIFLSANFLTSNKKMIDPTSAEDCSGHTGEFGQNPCKWSCNIQLNGNPVNTPSCCDEIEQTGDPFKCVFDARRVCTPQQCSTIPSDVKRQRCAQLYELNCCPIWTDACELKPPPEMLSLAPTSPMVPTATPIPATIPPTLPPTNIPPTGIQPTVQPTTYVDPTVNPSVYIRPSEPLYTVTPPPYSTPTRPYNPNPTPTYYFPPTVPVSSPNPSSAPNPSSGPYPSGVYPTNSSLTGIQPTNNNLAPTIDNPQSTIINISPTIVIAKPIIDFPNPEPVLKEIIVNTGNFLQKIKNSLTDFFRVVLP